MPVTVVLVDDHGVLCDALVVLLGEQPGIEVVGTAADGAKAVTLVQELKPDIVVLDIGLPKLDGIEAARLIRASHPATRVVALSMHSDRYHIFRALQAGVRAYVLKESAGAELVAAIRAVAEGNGYFSPAVAREIASAHHSEPVAPDGSPRAHPDCLSEREREVLRAVVDSRTTNEIAAQFDVSARTVETYRRRVMQKLRVKSVAELVRLAVREGMIAP